MTFLIHFIVALLVVAGSFFSIVAVMGFIRLPDVYTRLHSTGKVSVFGAVLLLAAAAIWSPVTWGHALVLIFLIIAVGPATAHAIGSAAYRIGLPRKGAQRDDLERNINLKSS
jgi:multicomponent Na+:H+ antiporter subunit G